MKLFLIKLILLLLVLNTVSTSVFPQDALIEENIVFPADAGIIDVTKAPYNADNTGATDVTTALQAAIDVAKGNLKGKIVYLPNGTYKVSNKLVFCTDAANHRGMIFQGQSRENTIIKLADNVATTSTAYPVIKCVDGAAFQNSMFNCSILNMTIDVGSGNPGAVGINYLANNEGTIRNVHIKSSDPAKAGKYGIDLSYSLPGPALIKNVTVDGFSYGIWSRLLQYGMTFENITLKNQLTAGIRNDAQTLSMRHLLSENTVPAIIQTTGGQSKGIITLIDSELKNGTADKYAIQLDDGYLFARNVKTAGYAAALRSYGTVVPGNDITEYVYSSSFKAFDNNATATTSLNMKIKETPEIVREDISSWVSVGSFGAIPGDAINDDTAIQAALNSGATTVYFPNPNNSETGSRYRISTTITIPSTVKHIIGLYTGMYPVSPLNTSSLPMFKFVGNTDDIIVMEAMRTASSTATCHFIEQASSRTLVLRNISIRNGFGYRNTGYGDVYLEDFHSLPANIAYNAANQQNGLVFKNQNVWARQLNPEQNLVNIVNDGGKLWILGFKSEYPNTLIETKNGGQTELLGGLHLTKKTATVPAFINTNSLVSVAGFGEARSRSTDAVYLSTDNVITETRGDETAYITASQLPTRKAEQDATLSFVLPLYVGYTYAALPLTLLSFKAGLSANGEKQVKLNWVTYNESGTANFIVERAAGSIFTSVGLVAATNSEGTHSYNFFDKNPLSGTSYYRLKQVDKNGNYVYNDVVSVTNSSGLQISVYPNPASSTINVVHPKANVNAALTIVDFKGNSQLTVAVTAGTTQTSGINIATLAQGLYLLVFKNGMQQSIQKIIKQ